MTPEVLKELWADYDYRFVLNDDLPRLMSQEATWILERGAVNFIRRPIEPEALLAEIAKTLREARQK